MSEATSSSPDGEQWLPVIGYEGAYEVSDQGRVRSLHLGRIMKTSFDNNYERISLRGRGGRGARVAVHRLVLEAFAGAPPSEDHFGLHLDDDTSNNRLDNLEWGTHSENMRQSVARGRHRSSRKSRCPRGHELVGLNVRPTERCRTCRACSRARSIIRRRGETPWGFQEVADAYSRYHLEADGRIGLEELMERYGRE